MTWVQQYAQGESKGVMVGNAIVIVKFVLAPWMVFAQLGSLHFKG
jgi:hypothetical protein